MKRKLALILIIILNVISCSETKKEDSQKHVEKDGVLYEANSNEPFTGIDKTYYENGQLKFEAKFQNGKPNGVGKEYFENGVLRFEGNFIDGKAQGEHKVYYENGKLMVVSNLINDKKEGLSKYYLESGELSSEVNL